MENCDATPQDGTADPLTENRLVCIIEDKAPRLGLEPRTCELTARRSTN